MNENMALTESTYYILLALAQPRHGYGLSLIHIFAAQKVAHDQRVHNVIKLLKQVSPKNRKGETHDLPADGAAGHERYALRMFLIIFPGVHRR